MRGNLVETRRPLAAAVGPGGGGPAVFGGARAFARAHQLGDLAPTASQVEKKRSEIVADVDEKKKSELVILLKPLVVDGPAAWGQSLAESARPIDRLDQVPEEELDRLAGSRHQGVVAEVRRSTVLDEAGLRSLVERRLEEGRKLLLLVTDGEPADIDERDPQHLRHDTRKAVEELHSKGILTYCLTLDPNADAYVKRIFGANNYTIVDHVDRLSEKLPTLFASLTS